MSACCCGNMNVLVIWCSSIGKSELMRGAAAETRRGGIIVMLCHRWLTSLGTVHVETRVFTEYPYQSE